MPKPRKKNASDENTAFDFKPVSVNIPPARTQQKSEDKQTHSFTDFSVETFAYIDYRTSQ